MTSSSLEDKSEGSQIASKEHCTPTELQLDQPLVLVPTHIPNDPLKFQKKISEARLSRPGNENCRRIKWSSGARIGRFLPPDEHGN